MPGRPPRRGAQPSGVSVPLASHEPPKATRPTTAMMRPRMTLKANATMTPTITKIPPRLIPAIFRSPRACPATVILPVWSLGFGLRDERSSLGPKSDVGADRRERRRAGAARVDANAGSTRLAFPRPGVDRASARMTWGIVEDTDVVKPWRRTFQLAAMLIAWPSGGSCCTTNRWWLGLSRRTAAGRLGYVPVAIALLALVFTVVSFWWLYARRGSITATTPRAYAFGGTGATLDFGCRSRSSTTARGPWS